MSLLLTVAAHMWHVQRISNAFPTKEKTTVKHILYVRVNMLQQCRLQAFDAAWSTYVCAMTVASDAVNHVTSTAGSALSQVITITGNAIGSAKWAAASTLDSLKVRLPLVVFFGRTVIL